MDDIEDVFRSVLSEQDSIDIAESEFKRMAAEDPELHAQYREWCHIVGSSERMGFRDFAEEYKARLDDVWESLTDYDEQQ